MRMLLLAIALMSLSACVNDHPYPYQYYNTAGQNMGSAGMTDREMMLEISRRQYLGQIFQNQHVVPTPLYDPSSPQWAMPRRQIESTPYRGSIYCNTLAVGSTYTTTCR